EKRSESGTVIEVQVTNPDRIEVYPVKIFLGHAMRHVGTAVEQDRSRIRLQPESGRGAMRMKNGGAGTEDNELHGGEIKLKIENCKMKIAKYEESESPVTKFSIFNFLSQACRRRPKLIMLARSNL